MRKTLLLTVLISGCTTLNSGYIRNYFTSVTEQPKDNKIVIRGITGTMYYPVPSQCDDSPLITAGNYHIDPINTSEQKFIAVSRDLLKVFKYGDKVKITNAGHKDGTYTITDTMNKRFKNTIDFLETTGTSLYKLRDIVLTKI